MSRSVVLIHDAAIDDYMSMVLLTTMPEWELKGMVIVNADCIGEYAMQTSWQIQSYIDRTDIPVTLSSARGLNPFPWAYRADCIAQGQIPALQGHGPNPTWPPYPDGDAWLRAFFQEVEQPVTVLCICPLTPIATLLDTVPDAEEKIGHLIWMGGAINVAGNLDPKTLPLSVANPYAEWNVFWDPVAAARVLHRTQFPVTLFPLDITDKAKLTDDFKRQLTIDGKRFRYANLALQSYGLVAEQPFYELWDVTTTVYLARPDVFAPPTAMRLKVVTAGDRAGALVEDGDGRLVNVVLEFSDRPAFYQYVLNQFRI